MADDMDAAPAYLTMATDPAHRHGGPDAGWYVPVDHGWQRISDGEVSDHGDAAHFMSDPNGHHGTAP